jgi:hypothetical protein
MDVLAEIEAGNLPNISDALPLEPSSWPELFIVSATYRAEILNSISNNRYCDNGVLIP